jgi:uncharacterized protein DUF4340
LTWKSTVAYWTLAAIFGAYYLVVEHRPAPPSEIQLAREKVLGIFADDVSSLTLVRDGKAIRCELRDKRWQIVEPPAAKVPPDLIRALIENLTDKQEAEEIDANPKPEDLAAFGFGDASPRIDVETKDGQKMSVTLGARNPPQTAIYAKTSLAPRVLLVGVNVQYYADLLYEAGAPKVAEAAASKDPRGKN